MPAGIGPNCAVVPKAEVKSGIPHVVKDLLDTVKKSEVVEDIERATTVTIVGEE